MQENIIKVLVIIFYLGMLCMLITMFFSEQLFYMSWIVMLGSGISMMGLIWKWGTPTTKPVESEKFILSHKKYEDLEKYFEETLTKKNYIRKKTYENEELGKVSVYAEEYVFDPFKCFTLVRVEEYTTLRAEQIDEIITDILKQYRKEGRFGIVEMIIVVCVDRITPDFKKLVNGNIEQGLNYCKLPVGISFGGKTIYVAKQEGGLAITKYKKLRREFFEIMNIKMK